MKKNYFFTILFLFLGSVSIFATITQEYAKEDKKLPDVLHSVAVNYVKKWDMREYDLPWVTVDNNGDGISDVAVILRINGYKKKFEVLDANGDGFADDFSFFDAQGRLVFQEVDSNYDKKIDLWITIENGKYMKRFQRDKDFDGYIDIDRTFE